MNIRSGKDEEATLKSVPFKKPSMTTMVGRRVPAVRRFRKTKSKAKDQVFSGIDKVPSMGSPPVNINKIYEFSCSQQRAAFLVSGAAEVFADFQWTLVDLNGAAEYQAVFDQYRCIGLEVWLLPRVTVNSSSTNDTGLITSVIDYDDSGTTTQAQMTEYTSYMIGDGMHGHYRSFVPAAIITVDGVEANVKQECWIDCTFGAVVHRGVKFAISATTTVQDYDLIIRSHVQFRTVR